MQGLDEESKPLDQFLDELLPRTDLIDPVYRAALGRKVRSMPKKTRSAFRLVLVKYKSVHSKGTFNTDRFSVEEFMRAIGNHLNIDLFDFMTPSPDTREGLRQGAINNLTHLFQITL